MVTIRARLLLALLLTAAPAFYFLSRTLMDDVKTRYFQVLEDSLVETANLTAALLESDVQNGVLSIAKIRRGAEAALARDLKAALFGGVKNKIALRIYVTDARGIVLYDSAGFALGHNYARWNDVYLTLQGRYGARSSRDDPRYPGVSVKYVAAPVRQNGKIIGVLTTAKPALTLDEAIAATREKIFATIAIAFAGFILIIVAVNLWITRPVALLTDWVKRLRAGERRPLPRLGKSEIGALGREFDLMQSELDGRRYIENFVQMLTHEFKSPVAGILGAAEILEGDPSAEDKKKFLGNIEREAGRIQTITENLLAIAKLENMRGPGETEWVHLNELLPQLAEDFSAALEARQLKTEVSSVTVSLRGNYFLLYQALANLVQNAIDFSLPGGKIAIAAAVEGETIVVTIDDEGRGIPEFALEKIFTKFYSLERPDTGRKGTGLGLAFVEQVVKLHGGTILIQNKMPLGVWVEIRLPG